MEVARVVAFELVARPRFVQRLERAADVLEAVAEDEVVAPLEHRRLPLVLKILVSLEHRKQSEVHRAHVEARDFRLPGRGGADAFFDRHIGRAACGEVDHDISRLLDRKSTRLNSSHYCASRMQAYA